MAEVARCTECQQPLRPQPTPVQAVALTQLEVAQQREIETCLGLQVCPHCGASCHDDASIENRGKCYDCHKAWQFGEETPE